MSLYARSTTYKRPRTHYTKRIRFGRRRSFRGISDRVFWAIMSFLGGVVITILYHTYNFFIG